MAINYHAPEIGHRYATLRKEGEVWIASGVATTDLNCVVFFKPLQSF